MINLLCMKENSLRGKRFLITQPMIQGVNGSTQVTLELAKHLQSQGAIVAVYTYYYDYPAKKFYDEANINVILFGSDELTLSDFDFIWVHSQVIPNSIINDLSKPIYNNDLPKFIFLHMSKFDWIPDEQPYIYNLENKLSSLSLFVSEEVRDKIKWQLNTNVKTAMFRNPAPVEFSDSNIAQNAELSKVLIVSNHPPREVLDAKNMLTKDGIDALLLGETGDDYRIIDSQFLSKFDVIITIGKTVQYCLTMGKPVYIYDKFGGDGYLNELNYKMAKAVNFSGRSGSPKSPLEIMNEVKSGYDKAVRFCADNRKEFIGEYDISSLLERVLTQSGRRSVKPFSKRYATMVLNSLMLSKQKFSDSLSESKHTRLLSKEISQYKNNEKILNDKISGITESYEGLQYDYNSIKYTSISYIIRFIKSKLLKK